MRTQRPRRDRGRTVRARPAYDAVGRRAPEAAPFVPWRERGWGRTLHTSDVRGGARLATPRRSPFPGARPTHAGVVLCIATVCARA